tara:strand:- start:423 stop:740 length:318 start_codon:yes stop_codon:yes gene_type:complete
MDSFAKFFSLRGPRHRGHGMTDTHHSYRRKHQNLVANKYKVDHTKHQAIERLKKQPGSCPCTPDMLDYIRKTFKIVPHRDKQQQLGKTGILMFYKPEAKVFMLKR